MTSIDNSDECLLVFADWLLDCGDDKQADKLREELDYVEPEIASVDHRDPDSEEELLYDNFYPGVYCSVGTLDFDRPEADDIRVGDEWLVGTRICPMANFPGTQTSIR